MKTLIIKKVKGILGALTELKVKQSTKVNMLTTTGRVMVRINIQTAKRFTKVSGIEICTKVWDF